MDPKMSSEQHPLPLHICQPISFSIGHMTITLTQECLHHHHQKAREIPHWKKFPKISLHLPPGFADQEFEDFFIASEDPDVTMTTTQPQSKPHPPQPSVGFGDSFSDHPVSAFTGEVTSDVISVGTRGFPLCVVQTH